ncbi:MAG: toll/interleukin-1 receptor domain-containing protein [Planctomycetota bacterium]|jgi:tetratricopeptide (TPR) repeat protein
MSKVFISYRRLDSADWSNRLYKSLWIRYGRDLVFQDVDDIKFGDDWLAAIREELSSCQVFLILIGPNWLVDSKGRRRLDDPDDVLRMEVSEALSSEGTVIPVLVGASTMPSSGDLPEPLKPLTRLQAVSLRDEKWNPDVEALIERLRDIILLTVEDLPLRYANQELYEMQLHYFDLLDNESAAEALEQAHKTQTYLNRVLPLYPQDPDLKVTRGYLFKNEAMALLRLKRYQEAEDALGQGEAIFRTMIDERERDAGAWNGLGSIEAVRGNFEKAHEYVDEALKILPDYSAALQDHEQILVSLGKDTCDVIESLKNSRRSNR